MNIPSSVEAVVIGAGPAGSMAAAALSSRGHAVLLLEKHCQIGSPLCCAEAISLRSLRLYLEPDPSYLAAQIQGAALYSPSKIKVEVDWPGVGVVLERKLFDRYLAQRAAQQGAQVTVNAEAVGLAMEDGRAKAVEIVHQGARMWCQTRLVIGADGVESLVGAWAGLNTRLTGEQLHSCAQYLLAGVDLPQDRVIFWVGRRLAPGGYVWAFPKGPGRANVGLGIVGTEAEKRRPKDYLDEFVANNFPRARILEAMSGGTPALGSGHPLWRGNILLTGDAARLTDSLSGAGIAIAMASGDLAGRLGAEYLESGDENKLARYPELWWAGPWRDLKFHHLVREVFLKLKDEEMDRIANLLVKILKGKDPAKLNPIEVARTVITSDPGILLLARHLL